MSTILITTDLYVVFSLGRLATFIKPIFFFEKGNPTSKLSQLMNIFYFFFYRLFLELKEGTPPSILEGVSTSFTQRTERWKNPERTLQWKRHCRKGRKDEF